jgi:hypothetical protein
MEVLQYLTSSMAVPMKASRTILRYSWKIPKMTAHSRIPKHTTNRQEKI